MSTLYRSSREGRRGRDPSRAGEGGGVSKRGDAGSRYFAKADVSEREGYPAELRKPGPRSQELRGEGRNLGNPSGLGLNWKEVGHSPRAPRESKKAKRNRKGGPPQNGLENGVGC